MDHSDSASSVHNDLLRRRGVSPGTDVGIFLESLLFFLAPGNCIADSVSPFRGTGSIPRSMGVADPVSLEESGLSAPGPSAGL